MKKRKPGWPRGLSAKTRKELMRLARRDYTPEEHVARVCELLAKVKK